MEDPSSQKLLDSTLNLYNPLGPKEASESSGNLIKATISFSAAPSLAPSPDQLTNNTSASDSQSMSSSVRSSPRLRNSTTETTQRHESVALNSVNDTHADASTAATNGNHPDVRILRKRNLTPVEPHDGKASHVPNVYNAATNITYNEKSRSSKRIKSNQTTAMLDQKKRTRRNHNTIAKTREISKNDLNNQQSFDDIIDDKELLNEISLEEIFGFSTDSSDLDDLIDENLLQHYSEDNFIRYQRISREASQTSDSSAENIEVEKFSRSAVANPPSQPQRKKPRSFVNNDLCDACKQPGKFVCCEDCPRSFHFYCAEPPVEVEDVEELEEWYCKECRARRTSNDTLEIEKNIFAPLIEKVERMNPQAFGLPQDIKKYFNHVFVNANGDYMDERDHKSSKNVKNEGKELSRLAHESGKAAQCHSCGKSNLLNPILACDYCPLYWHFDCLDPPLIGPPPGNKRWMCPAHVDHVVPPLRKPKNSSSIPDCIIADVGMPNDGDIQIILNPDFPDRKRTKRTKTINYKLPEDTIKLDFMNKFLQKSSRDDEAAAVAVSEQEEEIANLLLSLRSTGG